MAGPPLAAADFKSGTYELNGQPSTLAAMFVEGSGFAYADVVPGVGIVVEATNIYKNKSIKASAALYTLLAAKGMTAVVEFLSEYGPGTGDIRANCSVMTSTDITFQHQTIAVSAKKNPLYGSDVFSVFSYDYDIAEYDYDSVEFPLSDTLNRLVATIIDTRVDGIVTGLDTVQTIVEDNVAVAHLLPVFVLDATAKAMTGHAKVTIEKVTFYPPQPPESLRALATFPLPPLVEPLTLETVKDYLRVLDNAEDAKIEAMIPRARLWVEEHTGLALIQRQFTELHCANNGVVRVWRGPLVEVIGADYTDPDGAAQTFAPVATPPSTKLTGSWPTNNGQPFAVSYVAGLPPGQEDARLIGAMLALIEGEYSAGFAYPPDSITAAVNATFYLKFIAP